MAECLEAEGYAVLTAPNGAAALERLAAGARPALVVLDLVMPVMNGTEFLERLRALPQFAGLPVLLMTAAMPSRSSPIPAVTAVLQKPFEIDQLLEAVGRLCRRAA